MLTDQNFKLLNQKIANFIPEIIANFWLMLKSLSIVYQASIPTHVNIAYTLILTDAVAFLDSHFGASSGTRTVYLDEVQCTGRETNLTDCPRSPTVNCTSVRSYAGVRCQGLQKRHNDITFEL